MCPGVEDGDGYGGNEDRKVESKSADPKNHEQDRFQIGPFGDAAKPFDQAFAGPQGVWLDLRVGSPQQTKREEHGSK